MAQRQSWCPKALRHFQPLKAVEENVAPGSGNSSRENKETSMNIIKSILADPRIRAAVKNFIIVAVGVALERMLQIVDALGSVPTP